MMFHRPRRRPEPGVFHDPLSSYQPQEYADEFEKGLCEDSIAELATRPVVSVHPQTPVSDVLEMMAEKNLSCVVVCDEGKPIGIFSERDVLNRVAPHFNRTRDLPLSEVMTSEVVVVYETDHPARVLCQMSEGGFRHIPLVDVQGRCIGIIASRDIGAYLREHLFEA